MPSTALPWYPAIAWTEEWISLVNTTIAPLLVRRYLAAYFFPRTQHGRPDRAAIDAAPPNMEQHFSVLDRAVAKTSHLVGGTSPSPTGTCRRFCSSWSTKAISRPRARR